MSEPSPVSIIDGLCAIAERYDALICDIWGVVHNGRVPFMATIEALQGFRMARGPVVLLTNAPRPASDVKLQFDRIGVPHDCYDALITSGEGARAELERRASKDAPLRIYNLGPERDRAVRENLPVMLVEADDAEVVLCTGLFDDETEGPEDYRELLQTFLARGLEFLCANPDIIVRRGDKIVYCAGAIAKAYEEMGGTVVYFGKPYRPVFDLALARARSIGPAKSPLFIGDGLGTDIKGANNVGWEALFVAGGVHGVEIGGLPRDEAQTLLSALFTENAVHARWAIARLAW